MKENTTKVRVGVRVRPQTAKEIRNGGKASLTVTSPSIEIGRKKFTYDAVFDSGTDQEDMYGQVSRPLLESFVEGYNATIMAYGQTGSGKTFTMGSEAHSQPEGLGQAGLIPRFLADFFMEMQKKKKKSDEGKADSSILLDYRMTASFLEVYGEDVFDLLDSERKALPMREDSEGGVVIAGLTSRPVTSPEEALNVLHDGTMNRTTAATLMNLTSSRSHAVFTICLTQTTKTSASDQVDQQSTSKFTFVDLAGSERMKKTGAEGERAREGIKINEGLLALGNVINALADEERASKEKKKHVPYRQSKLTRLLQDALGGNSQTLFLACVSPSDTNASETLSTLYYANRARNIRNAPTKNLDGTNAELQRLYNLTHVLQCELVKAKFESPANPHEIGRIESSMMLRKDVEEYMALVHRKSQEMTGMDSTLQDQFRDYSLNPAKAGIDNYPVDNAIRSSVSQPLEPTPTKGIPERLDDSFLVEVNPDEDMAILDHLLELQQHDHDYHKDKKRSDEQLSKVNGELEQEETLLLQLRENLRAYHGLKQKYEELMAEVQQLEVEKTSLANKLEKASVDPSTGCSAAIKLQLENVELSLSRARRETLSHRQKYKLAEEQARRCRVLERKIGELKHSKTTLLKKQKEAAAKYKEMSDSKTKELLVLRRKEKATEMRMNKLRTEVQQQKNNLEKRKKYCSKLSEKLKQTESHLTKLLASRKRDLAKSKESTGDMGRVAGDMPPMDPGAGCDYCPSSEEISSMKFIFDKLVWAKVKRELHSSVYGERVAAYSDTMRLVVAKVKSLQILQESMDQPCDETARELENDIADLELKLDIVGAELSEIQAKMPEEAEELAGDKAASKLMSKMPSTMLRNMLLDSFSKLVDAETKKRVAEESLTRKDAALMSFESEVDLLNHKVDSLQKDLADRCLLVDSGDNVFDTLKVLTAEKQDLEGCLHATQLDCDHARKDHLEVRAEFEKINSEYSKAMDELALVKAALSQDHHMEEMKVTLDELNGIWETLGVKTEVRDQNRHNIQSCLRDTCRRMLADGHSMKSEAETEVRQLSTRLLNLRTALGQRTTAGENEPLKLLERADYLRGQVQTMEMPFKYAKARRERILAEVHDLMSVLGVSQAELPPHLKDVLQETLPVSPNGRYLESKREVGSTASGEDNHIVIPDGSGLANLESGFLSECEKELAELRVQKSKLLLQNRERYQAMTAMVRDMHVSEDDVRDLLDQSLRRDRSKADWWNEEAATTSIRQLFSLGKPNPEREGKHSKEIYDRLSAAAKCRGALSKGLRAIVERAQETLLDIVAREMDASEAYASFHDALFRLPSLSKDFCLACISEMEALVQGVDSMTQSEIEALTVVWEALKTPPEDRSNFWGEIDSSSPAIELSMKGLLKETEPTLALNYEDWVGMAAAKAKAVSEALDSKITKLAGIHKEVERLRSKQDTKSQILTLDSEIRILNVKMIDFEELQCSKQRLLSKKSGGLALLKEERFRKQMQGKFTAKLGQLASLLRVWEQEENKSFDDSLLSEDVRMLLCEPDNMERWVVERTELMPLRTVHSSKTPTKRPRLEKSKSRTRQTRLPPVGAQPKRPLTKSTLNRKPAPSGESNQVPRSRKRKEKGNAVPSPQKTDKESKKTLTGSSSRLRAAKVRKTGPTAIIPFGHVLSENHSPTSAGMKENL